MAQKIKKGDMVIVTKGRDSGRKGVVLSVLMQGLKLVVEGVNVVKRHTKPNPAQEIPGGIIQKEAPISGANVAIWNEAAKKADRVGFKFLADGQKVRIFKSTGEPVDLK